MSNRPLVRLGCQSAVAWGERTAAALGAAPSARVATYRTYPLRLPRPRLKPLANHSVTCPGCGEEVRVRVLSRWLSAVWAIGMAAGMAIVAALFAYLVYANWHAMRPLPRYASGALAAATACLPLLPLWWAFREPHFMRASILLPALNSNPQSQSHAIMSPAPTD